MKVFLHVVFWAYMFLSPMQYMRGTGMPMLLYVMNCMPSLLLMVVFYANYMWLTPRYFVEGKHRYFLLINLVMIIVFVAFQQYWMDFTNNLFHTARREPDVLDAILFIIRDSITSSSSPPRPPASSSHSNGCGPTRRAKTLRRQGLRPS